MTTKDIIERFDEKSKEESTWYNMDGSSHTVSGMTLSETRNFISSSLTELLDSIEKEVNTEKVDLDFMNKFFPDKDVIEKSKSHNKTIEKITNIINSHR